MKKICTFLIAVSLVIGMVGCGEVIDNGDGNGNGNGAVSYELTVSSTSGGSVVEPSEGVHTYEEGTVVDLVAEPDTGYRFVDWTGDVGTVSSVTAASTTMTMNGDYSVTASFEEMAPAEHTLTISSTAGGSVTTPGEGAFTYEGETLVDLGAQSEEGYRFDRWTGDVATVFNINMASTTIRIYGDYSITANFETDPLQVRAQRAMEKHEQAVEMVLDKARHDSYYKYALYTSRSLMVKHPEIYLKADGLFLETIQTNDGFQKTYETDDVHSESVRDGMTGPPFSFDLVDFTKYQIIRSAEIYPEHYPVLSYGDRRLLSVASTLKPVDKRVTQLGKAVQYYFALKEKAPLDQIYIIYCDNENTYLCHRGDLIFATELQNAEQIEGNPILVFNEERVWYPLMDRDDTRKDATLRQIVARYATDTITPDLSDFEAGLVSRFAEVTELEGAQIYMAVVAAARSSDVAQLQNQPFRSVWEKLELYRRAAIMRPLLKYANFLSPIAAYLSAITEEHEGEARIEALTEEYLNHAATPGWHWAHGHLWMLGIIEYAIEDSYYTYAGHCLAQAATMQAVLDIAGIDNYWIQGFILESMFGGHDYIYILEYDVIVDNGRLNKTAPVYHRSVLCHTLAGWPLKIIEFLAQNDRWGTLQHAPQYSGTLPPMQAIEMLMHLTGIHGDELQGQTWYPGRPRQAISFEELIGELEAQQEHWRPLKLP